MTTTQAHEIEAFLGDQFTPEQVEQITEEYLRLERDLPDDEEERSAALTAVAQRVDGVLDPHQIVGECTRAAGMHIRAQMARRAAVRAEVAAGMSESEAARRYDVNRMTVRSWTGK